VRRRRFLQQLTLAVGAFPILVPPVLRSAPSREIALASIGVGDRGRADLETFLAEPGCRVLAVCDVDHERAEAAKTRVNSHYGNRDCRVYYDFRNVLARPDIDAVVLALPNHWHAIPGLQAIRAGKDVYAEPPLAHSLREERAVIEAVRRYGGIWQMGDSLGHLEPHRRAVACVRQGGLGALRAIEIGLEAGHHDGAGTAGRETPDRAPPALDYEMWLGPAPWAPYCPARVHHNWRWIRDTGGGQLMDGIGHEGVVALETWGVRPQGPLKIEASGTFPMAGLWNSPTAFRITVRYPNDVTLVIAAGHQDIRRGIRWIGDRGWIRVDRQGLEAEPKGLLDESSRPGKRPGPMLPPHRRLLESIRSRRPTLDSLVVAHHAAALGHLGQVAMDLGRPLRFDPEAEAFILDPVATGLLAAPCREPWSL